MRTKLYWLNAPNNPINFIGKKKLSQFVFEQPSFLVMSYLDKHWDSEIVIDNLGNKYTGHRMSNFLLNLYWYDNATTRR